MLDQKPIYKINEYHIMKMAWEKRNKNKTKRMKSSKRNHYNYNYNGGDNNSSQCLGFMCCSSIYRHACEQKTYFYMHAVVILQNKK